MTLNDVSHIAAQIKKKREQQSLEDVDRLYASDSEASVCMRQSLHPLEVKEEEVKASISFQFNFLVY